VVSAIINSTEASADRRLPPWFFVSTPERKSGALDLPQQNLCY